MNYTTDILKKIVDEDRVKIEFQPIFSLNTRKYIGLEALAREAAIFFIWTGYAVRRLCSPLQDRETLHRCS